MANTFQSYSTTAGQTYSFYSPTDISGIIFEFTAINVSSTYTTVPSFENVSLAGFQNVSAIAAIDISASALNNLFYFEGFDIGVPPVIIPAMYGINASFNFSTLYSKSTLTYGAINTTTAINPSLKADYVNYLAYAITGGYNLADIFKNESALLDGVVSMDTNFNSKINASINNVSSVLTNVSSKYVYTTNASLFLDVSRNQSPFVQCTKALLDGLLSIPNTVRGDQFLTDLEEQNAQYVISGYNSNFASYYIAFHPGDVLSIVINYVPTNGNGGSIIGNNPVYTRSYKIMLKCN